MGLFSFLTGKQDTEDVPGAATPEPRGADTTPVAQAAETAAPPDHAVPDTPSDTPFTPPDAWNVDALLAPKPESGDKPEIGPVDPERTAALQPAIVDALKTVYDPEIPVDIYELGLIYGIDVDAEGRVLVRMTLTSPACPSAQQLPSEVRYKVKALPGVADAWVEIGWEPPWDKDRMSEAARLQLGIF